MTFFASTAAVMIVDISETQCPRLTSSTSMVCCQESTSNQVMSPSRVCSQRGRMWFSSRSQRVPVVRPRFRRDCMYVRAKSPKVVLRASGSIQMPALI